jgi:hypothetical protein
MAESNDRGDRETPTVVIAPDSNRANREYEGVVRATLLRFGSPDPDGDLIKTKDYWKHCQSVRIAPEVCGALIYETVRHRHDQTVMLRENVGLMASEPSAAAPTDRGQEWEVRVHRHRGYSLAKMKDVAGRKPDEITDRNIIWGEFYDDERAKEFARKLAQGGFIAVYGPRNELYRAGANESDWLTDLVRSKQDSIGLAFVPDVVRAMMAPPYSLSKTRAWKLLEVYTEEGELELRPEGGLGRLSKADRELCLPGPQGSILSQVRVVGGAAAPGSNEKAEDRVGFKWIDVSFAKTEDAEKFMKLIEKQASNIGAFMGGTTHGAIVTTNANDATIRKVLKKHRWQGAYSVPAELSSAADAGECAGDPSAMETIEAVAEPVVSNAVPWVKVTRDVDRYSAAVKTADKIGPIKDTCKVYDLLGDALNKEDQEVFCVVLLDLRGNLRGVCEVARGQRSRVTVGVADVLRPVIASGAEGYLVVHQHPSGKAMPSKADRDLTRLIAEATKPYGKDVCFIDHVVIGIGQAYSICESKLYKC